MKKVIINKWKKGIVFKNNEYKQLLNEGTYWFWSNEDVYVYDMTRPININVNSAILLQDQAFVNATLVVEVQDNEIVLQYENGRFITVLTTGKYFFWKGLINYSFKHCDLNVSEISEEIEISLLTRTELNNYVRTYEVNAHECAIKYTNGKFDAIIEPGIYHFWKNGTKIDFEKVDMRMLQLELSGQEILTRDKAALRINFYTQYQINDIKKALINNKEYEKQLYITIQLALREYIGTLSLDEILEKKENSNEFLINRIQENTTDLGITIKNAGIKDIILPGDMKEILNQVLIAEKRAQANTILRREETASTRNLLNTAKLMEDNAMLYKLKEMEYVEKIADKINNITISGGNQILDQMKGLFIPKK